MKQNKLFRPWPLTGLALFLVLLIGSAPAQAGDSSQGSALTATITVSPSTVTAIIPETGGETAYVDFFASWIMWAVLGLLLVVLLVALIMRPSGPVDPGSHHHPDD